MVFWPSKLTVLTILDAEWSPHVWIIQDFPIKYMYIYIFIYFCFPSSRIFSMVNFICSQWSPGFVPIKFLLLRRMFILLNHVLGKVYRKSCQVDRAWDWCPVMAITSPNQLLGLVFCPTDISRWCETNPQSWDINPKPPKNWESRKKFAGWFISMGKSQQSKWMITGGIPISGNLHLLPTIINHH